MIGGVYINGGGGAGTGIGGGEGGIGGVVFSWTHEPNKSVIRSRGRMRTRNSYKKKSVS
jgi:hypothetical protein